MHMGSGEIVGPTPSYFIYLSMPMSLYYQYIVSFFFNYILPQYTSLIDEFAYRNIN